MNTEPDEYYCACPQGYSGKTCQIGEREPELEGHQDYDSCGVIWSLQGKKIVKVHSKDESCRGRCIEKRFLPTESQIYNLSL